MLNKWHIVHNMLSLNILTHSVPLNYSLIYNLDLQKTDPLKTASQIGTHNREYSFVLTICNCTFLFSIIRSLDFHDCLIRLFQLCMVFIYFPLTWKLICIILCVNRRHKNTSRQPNYLRNLLTFVDLVMYYSI